MLTNDEKVILKNLPSKFKYITRHGEFSHEMMIFENYPHFDGDFFESRFGSSMHFNQYKHLFGMVDVGKCYEIKELLGE